MSTEVRSCQNCKNDFTIDSDDFDFYEKMDVPPPTWCPECRIIRRFAFRNERNLYKRKCDLCAQDKIMMYPEGTPFPVYCKSCWWSDRWDAALYGADYDPSRSFMQQFQELFNKVPRPGVIHQGNIVDSDYTNRVTDQRSCYLVFSSIDNEYCRYGAWMNYSKECMDCYNVQKCERCYECIDCFQCYRLRYSEECRDCTDSAFLYNCRNCQDCFGCVNLRNKRYYIWNEQYTKEEYEKKIALLQVGNALMREGVRAKFEALKRQAIVPSLVGYQNNNASGNWIQNCKNVTRSFGCSNVEEARYCLSLVDAKDVMDYNHWGATSERIYEAISVGRQCANLKFANECWDQVVDAEYVMNCHNSHDLFGCVGLRNSAHSILNKRYSPEEFAALADRIRQEMPEYGEFFPMAIAPSAYNETIAQEFFPLPKEAVTAAGLAWKEDAVRDYQITLAGTKVPETIGEVQDGVVKEVIGCAHGGACSHRCTTAFRIIPEELAFYRAMDIPPPKLCPNCRHFERLSQRNPLKLWARECMCAGAGAARGQYKNSATHFHGEGVCPSRFETSYAPDRPEIVYCEQCYTAEIA